jgi:hypothetical protein
MGHFNIRKYFLKNKMDKDMLISLLNDLHTRLDMLEMSMFYAILRIDELYRICYPENTSPPPDGFPHYEDEPQPLWDMFYKLNEVRRALS